eukprot:TRINITY_DN13084_c0_g1_i1.p1 TRINITY_DN13084_c0_g1~~TRINITY_DN13084_c0_g1_i1.p1  ORF type:complete len:163 (-),score=23.59 TRINITY_DN13084_c0_g1_i1:49-504(-)
MHRDVVTHVKVTKTNFIITASVDGTVCFWKKKHGGIEFVKRFYRIHSEPVSGLSVSADGSLLCTTSADRMIRFYDVVNFDMITFIEVDFKPSICSFINSGSSGRGVVAVAEKGEAKIRVFASDKGNTPINEFTVHRNQYVLIDYNEKIQTW